jgi:hypothetical protein
MDHSSLSVVPGAAAVVQQVAIGDCLSFDPFPFDHNGLAPPEVDVGWRQVADALVISQVIVVGDEGLDLGFEIARQRLHCRLAGVTRQSAFRCGAASPLSFRVLKRTTAPGTRLRALIRLRPVPVNT